MAIKERVLSLMAKNPWKFVSKSPRREVLVSGASEVALLEATGANVHLALLTILHDGDTLDVGTELTIGNTVGVANRTASYRVLTADLANLRHVDSSVTRAPLRALISNSCPTIPRTLQAARKNAQHPRVCGRWVWCPQEARAIAHHALPVCRSYE